MAELTNFEKNIIDTALILYKDAINAELKDLENQDKRPIFTGEYFEVVCKDIRLKLKIKKDK